MVNQIARITTKKAKQKEQAQQKERELKVIATAWANAMSAARDYVMANYKKRGKLPGEVTDQIARLEDLAALWSDIRDIRD